MICENCKKQKNVMLEMDKGSDKPWWLCVRCWLDGFHVRAERERRRKDAN